MTKKNIKEIQEETQQHVEAKHKAMEYIETLFLQQLATNTMASLNMFFVDNKVMTLDEFMKLQKKEYVDLKNEWGITKK